jgi:hypothetical protein
MIDALSFRGAEQWSLSKLRSLPAGPSGISGGAAERTGNGVPLPPAPDLPDLADFQLPAGDEADMAREFTLFDLASRQFSRILPEIEALSLPVE